ncbi:hypothetical protein QYE76_057945 [Lolium multiflorum]|uniref:KIB1-4 beta-propeller domain-containing protein n=1 Tax=Lolium multiflorum TaxID=4521 RepID=A0AAD8T5V7_LOLMU|nr:hypothetical protein QYE76_057945 [Lolium multiflorum]
MEARGAQASRGCAIERDERERVDKIRWAHSLAHAIFATRNDTCARPGDPEDETRAIKSKRLLRARDKTSRTRTLHVGFNSVRLYAPDRYASTRYADVIHHNGAFHTLTRGDGSIEAWDGRRNLKPRLVTGPVVTWEFKRCVEFHSETFRQQAYYEGARYLAERDDGGGGLLVVSTVAIFDDGNALRTRRFKVFGVDEREGEWRALQDVGDEVALLVGINHGRRVSTREYPCLKPNCVYYVLRSFAPEFDAMDEDGHDGEECLRYESGVYDLRSGVPSRKSVFRRAGGGHPYVGINHGRRVSTREYPCLKPNCVYYVLRSFAPEFDAMDEDGHDGEECLRYESGVYDLRTGVPSRKSVFRRAGGGHPVWFVPPVAAPRR